MKTFLSLFYRINMKNKAFTLFNIIGLAVGMAGFILIMLWVKDELSYDKFNEKESRIVRVMVDYSLAGQDVNSVTTLAPMAAVLKNDFPEVENVVRFRKYNLDQVQYGEKYFTERRSIFADSTVFDIFTIPLIKGNPKNALSAPNTITISESIAKKYFGDTDPLGKTLNYGTMEFEITGVYKDIPKASHFNFDFIASIYSFDDCYQDDWGSFNFVTYVLLKENIDPQAFEKKLSILVDTYIAVTIEQYLDASWEEIQEQGTWFKFRIQRLRDIHLHSHYYGELGINGDAKNVYIFISIAIFILLLACINFTNLSTAKAITRAKEIGVKKVFGERVLTLISHHLSESFIIVFIAHMAAMILVEVFLPFFNDISAKNLSIEYSNPQILLSLFGLIVITSLVAGSYPAFYLSSYKPISALKSEITAGKKKTRFRSVMVIGQFVISIILLSSTLVLNKQLNYIQTKDLGYEKENLVCIWNSNLGWNNMNNLKDDLSKNPMIKNASISGFLPIPSNSASNVLYKDGIRSTSFATYNLSYVDHDYINTLGINIIKGRGFSEEFPTDLSAVLINKAAARSFGWDDPIGKIIGRPRSETEIERYTVIGVLDDFNFESVHNPISPMVCFLGRSRGAITVRLEPDTDISSSIKFLESKWEHYSPGSSIDYTFYNDSLNHLYASETKLNQILEAFTFIAFFVSCRGLIGLAMFTTEQRKKEIGIRKVVGASITQVGKLLSYDFTKLIIIAFLIATPVSYYIISKWLENYAYQTKISWWIFVLAGLISYVTAMIAIGYQSYKASAANPVDTLRDE
ncbi:MAG: FtsX-like permease family protein [Bacteroidales bacterium]|nr:FtsX-like permease family protein [Bacteroidales bacterium]